MKLLKTLLVGVLISPVIALGTTVYQVNFYDSAWEERPPGDCLMILGSRVKQDNTPDLMMHERVNTAIKFISKDMRHLILTGGTIDETSPESEVLKALFLERGVEEKKILLENKSTSTYENFLFSKPLIAEAACEKLDVLSHDFHLARVKMTADKLEIPINRLIPAENTKPNTKQRLSREYLAYLWYWLGWEWMKE